MSMDNNDDVAVQEAREKAGQAFNELYRKILDVLPTIEEAFSIMSKQLEELKLEASAELLQNTGYALESLIKSLPVVFFENDNVEKVNQCLNVLDENIETIVNQYESQNIMEIKKYLDTELTPNFKSFRQELEAALHKSFMNA